ncbi:hypothetical protein ACJMK2_019098 [Sinanodonta woodiana]|uniref:ADP-ribosyl cyclase/cyclic ADP-ribose hydrolase n=1 Tax=Sinanodonta woodiana TaxID=1069815 RepID=A0ABD3UFQ3_SINWO
MFCIDFHTVKSCLRSIFKMKIAASSGLLRIFLTSILTLVCNAQHMSRNSMFSLGTTRHISEIFIGRCYDYPNKYNIPGYEEKDCKQLWTYFSSAFQYKDPCEFSEKDYQMFIEAASIKTPENQTLFWSGSYVISHEYAETSRRYFTLEDILIGYVVNNLTWCGQKKAPGIDYDTCPQTCGKDADSAFWGKASSSFAAAASGEVTLVLNGSNPNRPAYDKNSYFGRFELPALNKSKVHNINILLIHGLDTTYSETCTTGSVLKLQSDIKRNGLNYTCTDDPKAIVHLLCVEDPNARECQLINRLMGIAHSSF